MFASDYSFMMLSGLPTCVVELNVSYDASVVRCTPVFNSEGLLVQGVAEYVIELTVSVVVS